MFAPIDPGTESQLFISKSYDPTSHFETTCLVNSWINHHLLSSWIIFFPSLMLWPRSFWINISGCAGHLQEGDWGRFWFQQSKNNSKYFVSIILRADYGDLMKLFPSNMWNIVLAIQNNFLQFDELISLFRWSTPLRTRSKDYLQTCCSAVG